MVFNFGKFGVFVYTCLLQNFVFVFSAFSALIILIEWFLKEYCSLDLSIKMMTLPKLISFRNPWLSKIWIITSFESHLKDVDIDLQLPIHNTFDYYSTNEFHTSLEIQNLKDYNYFSFMHINLRSLSANFDNLSVMLEELQFPFSIMGYIRN